VRRLADEHQPGVADEIEDRLEVFHPAHQRMRRGGDRVDQHSLCRCHADLQLRGL
jgi:hypothetical protein